MWETVQNCADLDCFRVPILLVTLKTQKSTSGGILRIFGSQTFVPISWMCKKQTAVLHSSEPEVISFHAGLCMDGIHRLDLWDSDLLQCKHSVKHVPMEARRKISVREKLITFLETQNFFRHNALLYIFEDSEAVIKD